MRKTNFLITFLTLVSSVSLSAQGTQTYSFFFPITYVSHDNTVAAIDAGMDYHLQNGQIGRILSLYDSEVPERTETLGSATIDALDDNASGLAITATSEEYRPSVGDLVELSVDLPVATYRSHFFEFQRNAIRLNNVFGSLIFSDDFVNNDVTGLAEQKYFEDLVAEVVFVAKEMRSQMESPTVEGGLYDGLDLFTAMEQATWRDIRHFMRYVIARPRKYMGQTWNFSEIFATWLVSQTPMTQEDILQTCLEADDAHLQKIVKAVKDEMPIYNKKWRSMAEVNSESKNVEVALAYADLAIKMAQFIDNQDDIAWGYFVRGEVLGDADRYAESIISYEKSVENFKYSENEPAKVGALINLANMQLKAGDSKKSLQILKEAQKISDALRTAATQATPLLDGMAALILRNMGDCHQSMGKPKKSLEFYTQALELIDTATEDFLVQRKATIYLKMSEAYKALNNKNLADEYEQKAINLYRTTVENLSDDNG